MTPLPLDPFLYRAHLGRVIEANTVLLNLNLGFGNWILGSKWPGGPDAKHPQGRYRLNGIDAPRDASVGRAAMDRICELAQGSSSLLAKTTKRRGKYPFLVDLYVKRPLPSDDPVRMLDVEQERKHWLSNEDLVGLIKQSEVGEDGSTTIRALATEVLWSRRALRGFSDVVHVNQHLLDEELAVPHSSGERQ